MWKPSIDEIVDEDSTFKLNKIICDTQTNEIYLLAKVGDC